MDKHGDFPASNVSLPEGMFFSDLWKLVLNPQLCSLQIRKFFMWKKYRRGTTLGPFGSIGPSFGKRKNSWMLKRGVIGTPQVATQLFCKNWIWMKKQLPCSGDFTRRPFLFRFDSVCFTSFPMGVLGSEFVLKKTEPNKRFRVGNRFKSSTKNGHRSQSCILDSHFRSFEVEYLMNCFGH